MKKIKIKKSQLLLLGSLIIIIGVLVLTYNKIILIKEEVFNEVRLSVLDKKDNKKEEKVTVPEITNKEEKQDTSEKKEEKHYSFRYLGYLEIPKIKLKRGFLDKDNKYNYVDYNIMISPSSSYPDEDGGNVILFGHSGAGPAGYFHSLNKLEPGDKATITYKGNRYTYSLVKIEEQDKTGTVAIHRPDIYTKSLTLVTCTLGSDTKQTIFIFNIV